MSISKYLYVYVVLICTGCAQKEIWQPNAALSPQAAVEIQLRAFQSNHFPESDFGIKTAWEFASPANKKVTGPYERFQDMLLSDDYAPLLRLEEFKVDEHFRDDRYAEYFVVARTRDAQWIHYIFDLAYQNDNSCWMVDAVLLIPDIFQPSPQSVATAKGIRPLAF